MTEQRQQPDGSDPLFVPEGEYLLNRMREAVAERDAWKLVMTARCMDDLIADPESRIVEQAGAIERFANARAWEHANEVIQEMTWDFVCMTQPEIVALGMAEA